MAGCAKRWLSNWPVPSACPPVLEAGAVAPQSRGMRWGSSMGLGVRSGKAVGLCQLEAVGMKVFAASVVRSWGMR